MACLYGNYAGDNMNVKMAIKLADEGRHRGPTVVANDDVPLGAARTEREKRRGVAGEILMWKVGGAKAALGGSLDEVHRRGAEGDRQLPLDRRRPWAACTLPAVGQPNFSIEAGEMEVGIGHHGEPGMQV